MPIRPSEYQIAVSDNYVSSLDIHKPDILEKLVDRYSGKNFLDFFETNGQMEAVTQTQYSHYEKNFITEYFTVQSTTANFTAGQTGTFVIAAGDYIENGTVSLGQKGDIVLLPNGTQAEILSKNTSTPGAHIITLAPSLSSEALGIMTAGMAIPIVGNEYAEGTDQPLSNDSGVIKLTFTNQILKADYSITGTELTNRLWFKVPAEGGLGIQGNGKEGWCWGLQGMPDTLKRFKLAIETSMFVGKLTDNVTITAGGGRTMQGVWDFVEQNDGIVQRTGGSGRWNYSMLQQMIKKLDKNYGAKENTVWMALPLKQDWDTAVMNMVPNGAVSYASFGGKSEVAIAFGFDSIKTSGYTFHSKIWDLLNNPKGLGAPGQPFGYSGLVVPGEDTMDAKTRKRMKPLSMCYKDSGDGYKRDMEHWVTGGAAIQNKTDGVDRDEYHFRCERSVRIMAPNKFVKIMP